MRMGIGLGIGINRSNYAQGIFNAYSARVVADGGVVESGSCVDAVSSLLQTASLLLIPSGYKSTKLYSEIPTNGNGDLTWTRTSTAIRTNSSSLLESMATGVPRLSYMYGSCPALLLEPQRTNLLLQSQDFDNAYWGKQSGATVTANTTTSPDGSTNADTINLVSGSTISRVEKAGISYTASTSYTLSFYLKNIALTSGQTFAIRIEGSGGFDLVGTIDLFNNTNSVALSGTAGSGFVSSSQRATYDILANGWVRCSIGLTTGTNAGTATVYIISNVNANRSFYAYGAQLEAGAYPTTYIPTTGSATATRVADSFSRSNIYTNGLITSSGGTWFVELRDNIDLIRNGSAGGIFINTGTLSLDGNGFLLRNPTSSSQKISIIKYIAGVALTLYNTITTELKVAIKWNGTTADVFVNGTKVVSATAFTTTTMENLIGEGTNRSLNIQQMALFPSPLSDTDCTTLTTL